MTDSGMAEHDLLILLTNDDGSEANGLKTLKSEVVRLGKVVVVAPYEERSAISHALTIHYPIRVIEMSEDHYALTGTPADCVLFALRKLLKREPDLVISGINHGPNLGDDILYSGTVAGAREAALHRIPAVAVSLVTSNPRADYAPAARFVRRLISKVYPERIPRGTFLNINIPKGEPKEYRFTRQGSRRVVSSIEEKRDPRGRTYYWIGRDQSEWIVEADTDYQAVHDGAVSITPLHRDQTDYRALKQYAEEENQIRILD